METFDTHVNTHFQESSEKNQQRVAKGSRNQKWEYYQMFSKFEENELETRNWHQGNVETKGCIKGTTKSQS